MVSRPAVTPVTRPEELMVALPLLALQVPPVVASVSNVLDPVQTDEEPLMALTVGKVLTVTL